jgi:TRAP-type C4-dicarboxylate transport system substrate-binding protein
MTNTMFLIMNKDLFSSLSDDDKKLISKISHEWTLDNYAAIMKENIKYRKQLEEFGLKILDYTPEQWLANGKICRAKEWPLMEKKVGKKVMDIVRKNATKF